MRKSKRLLALVLATAMALTMVPSLWAQEKLKININQASVQELVQLKNIGQKYAERIVQHREKNGPFESPEEITKVPGIGQRTLELNKERIVVE